MFRELEFEEKGISSGGTTQYFQLSLPSSSGKELEDLAQSIRILFEALKQAGETTLLGSELTRAINLMFLQIRDGNDILSQSKLGKSNLLQVLDDVYTTVEQLPSIIQSSSIPAIPIVSRTLKYALEFIDQFFMLLVFYNHQARKPHVATEGEGEVSFSWRYKDKVLTFFVEPDGTVDYLKVWGPNIHDDMEEGTNPTDFELIDLWRWLNQ